MGRGEGEVESGIKAEISSLLHRWTWILNCDFASWSRMAKGHFNSFHLKNEGSSIIWFVSATGCMDIDWNAPVRTRLGLTPELCMIYRLGQSVQNVCSVGGQMWQMHISFTVCVVVVWLFCFCWIDAHAQIEAHPLHHQTADRQKLVKFVNFVSKMWSMMNCPYIWNYSVLRWWQILKIGQNQD